MWARVTLQLLDGSRHDLGPGELPRQVLTGSSSLCFDPRPRLERLGASFWAVIEPRRVLSVWREPRA
ncbi:MAG: hypothetical protein H6747_06685 [Deltaproteobacteria bacterium]|nr:hypothetical protein [Deltaproteobacteria bacterium]